MVRTWSNRNSHSLLVGMQKGRAHSGRVLFLQNQTCSYRMIQQWIKWSENWHPHKNVYVNVYSSFIHNCPNFGNSQMSFSWWMDKLWYNGPIDNGILFSNKQKWDTKPRKERGTLNGYYGAREANLKRLYGTEFQLRDCGKRKMGDNKKTSGCQRFAGRKEWVEQGISGEVKTVFCDTLQLWLLMSLYMLSKPTECTAQKPEP